MLAKFVSGLLLVSAVGCGGPEYPPADPTQSKTAISAAEAVGAQSVPQAALHLKMAKDQLSTAEALIADGENDEAFLVLQRATVDAELALALAREESVKGEANEALKKVEKLKRGE